jgi:hypothetical protein
MLIRADLAADVAAEDFPPPSATAATNAKAISAPAR